MYVSGDYTLLNILNKYKIEEKNIQKQKLNLRLSLILFLCFYFFPLNFIISLYV